MKNLVIFILIILNIFSCNGIMNKKSDNKWQSILAFFRSNSNSISSNQNITLGLTLTGPDGNPLSIGNASTKSIDEVKNDAAKPAPDSNVPPVGGSGDKAGEENLKINFNGNAKAVEIYDSNGGYSGTITVKPRTGNEKDTKSFLSFALKTDREPAAGDITGVFYGDTINFDVPFQDVTNLQAVFTHDGGSVLLGTRIITTGTSLNFSNPQVFTVKAKDGTTKEYTVMVNRIQYTCELAGIYFTDYPMAAVKQKNDTTNTWYEASLPPDANLSALKTSFSIYGTTMRVGGTTQTSGISTQNFNGSNVTFTVQGSNGCTQNYVVKASHEVLRAGARSYAGKNTTTKGTLDLVDIPQITKVNTIGLGKPVSMVESEAAGYFDDVDGTYTITPGQIKVMVPWGTLFDTMDISIEVETKNNAKSLMIDGRSYAKGMGVRFKQKPGREKHTVDAMLIDTYSAFEVPYEIQIVMGAPPPFLAVSKDSTFMLFVNSNAADARDESKDLEALMKTFAPTKMGQMSSLEELISYINTFQIDVARWTIDPNKVELNVIGRGFQNFDMDLASYREDYKCFNYSLQMDSYNLQLALAPTQSAKFLVESRFKSLHNQMCGKTKSYQTYPKYPKTPPSVSDYGGIKANLDSFDGYGLKKALYANDIAYMFTDFASEKPVQEDNSFTIKSSKGDNRSYTLPSPNYMDIEPQEGTVGTEMTVRFRVPINPANFTLNLSMDKIPVLNTSFVYNPEGRVTGVKFNVPYTMKSTRVVCERIPINGIGERFHILSGDVFKMNPYKELRGLSYASKAYDYTVRVDAPFHYPSLEFGKATYYTIKSGKLPAGLNFSRSHGVIFGKPIVQSPASTIIVEANDGYKQVQTELLISANLPVVIPSPTLLFGASGYTLLTGKKFTIAPSTAKGTNVRYSIDRPLPQGIQFDRETGVFSGYPTNLQAPTTYIVRASNPSGFAIFSVSFQVISDRTIYAPPTLSYGSTNYPLGKGFDFSFTPTFTGTAPNTFSAIGLPDGMSINMFTGVISGTPTNLQDPSPAIVTLTNYAGVSQFSMTFSVENKPPVPTNLAYAGTPFTFTTLVSVGVIKPTHTSVLTSCVSSPTLPAGLTLQSNCEITGTATATQGNTAYAITGSNLSGSTSANINITIVAIPPANLVYSGTPFVLTHNSPMTVATPSLTGNATTCTSAPALPAGLAINNTTCAIAGTPTVQQGANNYTITATNPFGSTNVVISITVSAMAPSALTYVGTPYSFFQSTAASSGTPSYSGSPLTNCTSSPGLPAGLSISATTCTISGSPSSQQGSISYTITASNGSGSTQATIQIAIGPAPPNGLSYVGSPFMFYKNGPKTETPTMTGSPTSCTSSPALPAGLTINNTTCAISGSATTLQDPVSYTITASNASGSNTATLSIQVAHEWYRDSISGPIYGMFTSVFFSGNRHIRGTTGDMNTPPGVGSQDSSTGTNLTFSQTPVGCSNESFKAAISGNVLVTGKECENTNTGQATVYRLSGTVWQLEATITASNSAVGERFGAHVSVSGDTIAVFAEREGSESFSGIINGTGTPPTKNQYAPWGAIYIYRKNGAVWEQEAFIKENSMLISERPIRLFGDRLFVPKSNGCYVSVYHRTGTTWSQQSTLSAYGGPGYSCNPSIDMDGDTLVIGSELDTSTWTGVNNGTSRGVISGTFAAPTYGGVDVYRWNGSAYIREAHIKAFHLLASGGFGAGVSISGDVLAVLSWNDRTGGGIYNSVPVPPDTSGMHGAIYIYRRTGTTWKWESMIKENSLTSPFGGTTLQEMFLIGGNTIYAQCGGNKNCTYKLR